MDMEHLNPWQRFWKIIVNPFQAFRAIKEDPSLLVPLLAMMVFFLAITALVVPETREFTRETLVSGGMSPDQVNASLKNLSVMSIIGVLLTMPLMWLMQAAVLLIYNQIGMGEARFKQLYVLVIYASLPSAIHQFLLGIITKFIGLKGAMQIKTSLALVMSGNTGSFAYRFLDFFDLFSLWGLGLLIFGGAVVMNKAVKGLAVYLLVLWVLLALGLAFLGGLFPTPGLS